MQQALSDLIAAHKLLCEAVAGQGVGSGAPRHDSPENSAPRPQSPADSQYLSEEEDARLEEHLGLKAEPILARMQAQQFQELFLQRQELRAKPDAPQFITPEVRAESRANPRIPSYSNIAPGPVPVPDVVEDVPPEIRMRDEIQNKKWAEPENLRPARPVGGNRIMSGIVDDFNDYQSQQG